MCLIMFRVSQATEGSFLHRSDSVMSFLVSINRSLWWSMGAGRFNFQWLCGFQLNPDSCVRRSHLTKPEVEKFTGSSDTRSWSRIHMHPKTQRRKRGQFDEVDQLPQRPHLLERTVVLPIMAVECGSDLPTLAFTSFL